jgi:probable rRNA maturation factor
MPIHLEILEAFRAQTDTSLLSRAAETTLKHQSVPEATELSLVIADDEQLQLLNRQFRGLDKPTDVLSFPADMTDPESGAEYLGDIIISFERAKAQAIAGGHSITAELQLLIIHGILHLLGHDHADPQEKNRMWQSQNDILNQLCIANISPSE